MPEQKKGNSVRSAPTGGQGADFLFVYGTLRKDFGLVLMQSLGEALKYLGIGSIDGLLCDLGDYPGAIKQGLPGVISGDVFEVKFPNDVFPLLDEYEGDEYKREKTPVKMMTGEKKEAWVYWYTAPVAHKQIINGSDYLEYLKNKKDSFA